MKKGVLILIVILGLNSCALVSKCKIESAVEIEGGKLSICGVCKDLTPEDFTRIFESKKNGQFVPGKTNVLPGVLKIKIE